MRDLARGEKAKHNKIVAELVRRGGDPRKILERFLSEVPEAVEIAKGSEQGREYLEKLIREVERKQDGL
jgi:hypothetical protein